MKEFIIWLIVSILLVLVTRLILKAVHGEYSTKKIRVVLYFFMTLTTVWVGGVIVGSMVINILEFSIKNSGLVYYDITILFIILLIWSWWNNLDFLLNIKKYPDKKLAYTIFGFALIISVISLALPATKKNIEYEKNVSYYNEKRSHVKLKRNNVFSLNNIMLTNSEDYEEIPKEELYGMLKSKKIVYKYYDDNGQEIEEKIVARKKDKIIFEYITENEKPYLEVIEWSNVKITHDKNKEKGQQDSEKIEEAWIEYRIHIPR